MALCAGRQADAPPPCWMGAQRPSNIRRLTCICGFADAHSSGKVGAKVA